MPGTGLQIVYYFVIAFAVGTVAQLVTGYRKRTLLTTMVLGFIGVVCGDLFAKKAHFLIQPKVFDISIFWSIAGAVLFILAYRLIRGKW